MHQTEAELSPDERRREIASILAAGVLRLKTRPGGVPDPTAPRRRDNPLDLSAPPSPHGRTG